MLDKVDVALPTAQTRQDFYQDELLPFIKSRTLSSSKNYRGSIDIRPLGIPAFLHLHHKFAPGAFHKVEFIGTGALGLSEITATLARIACEPLSLKILRLDFAVDVPGYSVSWFREHTWVADKRVSEDFEKVRNKRRHGEIESMYFGVRPNFFRIYDKVSERKQQYQTQRRRCGAAVPTFEEVYGCPADGFVLTRVERQCCGRHIPPMVATFGQLRKADECRPFEPLHFEPSADYELNVIDGEGFPAFSKRIALDLLIQRHGLQGAKGVINRLSRGNGARILRNFLRPKQDIKPPDLQAIYEESVRKQLSR